LASGIFSFALQKKKSENRHFARRLRGNRKMWLRDFHKMKITTV